MTLCSPDLAFGVKTFAKNTMVQARLMLASHLVSLGL